MITVQAIGPSGTVIGEFKTRKAWKAQQKASLRDASPDDGQ
jgi:hypothetical protein